MSSSVRQQFRNFIDHGLCGNRNGIQYLNSRQVAKKNFVSTFFRPLMLSQIDGRFHYDDLTFIQPIIVPHDFVTHSQWLASPED